MPMTPRLLANGLSVSKLGLGCMPMSGNSAGDYGTPDEREAIATIHAAIDIGVTHFDTAEAYGPFANEELLGKAIRGKREGLVIATKFYFNFAPASGVPRVDGSPANARRSCEAALKRLGTDRIDIFYLHRLDPQIPVEDSVGGIADLISEGKVRHIGVSELGAGSLRRAHATHPVTALQSEYSLWERTIEEDILPVARELGIGIVPFSPLGRGLLTGTIAARADLSEKDFRLGDPRYSDANLRKNLGIVDGLRTVAARHGVSPAQVALAWLLAQGEDIAPIPGTKRRETLLDSMAAASLNLSAAEIAELEAAAPVGATAGDRYRPEHMATVRL
jgi:aryl-alcohol dehydrogenase-like predicted oxidoreductase